MAGKPSDQKLTQVKLVRGLLLTTLLTFLNYAVIVQEWMMVVHQWIG